MDVPSCRGQFESSYCSARAKALARRSYELQIDRAVQLAEPVDNMVQLRASNSFFLISHTSKEEKS